MSVSVIGIDIAKNVFQRHRQLNLDRGIVKLTSSEKKSNIGSGI